MPRLSRSLPGHLRPALSLCIGVLAVVLLGTGAARPTRTALLADPSSPRPAVDAVAPKAYVGLFGDNAVAVIDTGTHRLLRTIAVPPGPHGLVVTPDGREVYVSSDGASTVSVIDTATDQVVQSIEVGRTPHGLAITPDGRRVLVAGFGTDQVLAIDTSSKQVVGQVDAPSPHNIAITPDGATAYVAAQKSGATGLVLIDIASMTHTGDILLDKVPRALNFSPDGMRLYVTLAGSDAVQVIDPAAGAVVSQIPVGASPHHVLFTPDGEYGLVVSQGTDELTITDAAASAVTGTVTVGRMPHWIALTPDGDTAFVTNEMSGDISVVDLETRRVTDTFPVGNAPRKIVVQPAPAPGRSADRADGAASASIAGFAFAPATITVTPGGTVMWTNNDSVAHTVTSADGLWDSGAIPPGESFSFTFDQPGTYAYACSIHPFMQGMVVVEG